MPIKFTKLVNIRDFCSPAHGEKLVREMNQKFIEMHKSISALDDLAGRDVSNDFEQYVQKVDDIVSVMLDRTDEAKAIAGSADELLNILDIVLDRLPFHCAFDARSTAGQNAENWCGENCVGGYEFIGMNPACMVIFDIEADWMLFKIKFGLT